MQNRTSASARPSILLLSDTLEAMGGAERSLYILAAHLRKRGYRVIIASLKAGAISEELRSLGFQVHDLNIDRIYGFRGISGLLHLAMLIIKERIPVMITYHESSDFMAVALRVLTGIRVISSRRDMGFQLKKRHLLLYRLANPFFSAITAVSTAVGEQIVRTQKVKPKKITVIFNGIDPSLLRQAAGRDSRFPFLKGNVSVAICCLANIRPIKGHEFLIQAAARIKENRPDFTLYLVGIYEQDDPYYSRLKNMTSHLGLEDQVVFCGPVPPSDVNTLLRQMDLSVLPSLSEGMSNALLESMEASLPIVATCVGGNSDVVIHGETGFLVPPEDPGSLAEAIMKLISDKSLRKAMGEKGSCLFHASFSAVKMVDKYEDILRYTILKKIGKISDVSKPSSKAHDRYDQTNL